MEDSFTNPRQGCNLMGTLFWEQFSFRISIGRDRTNDARGRMMGTLKECSVSQLSGPRLSSI